MEFTKKIKKGDTVVIIAGKDKNKNIDKLEKTGKISEVNKKTGRVFVEGLNLVKKTMKKTQQNQVGGIKDIEASLNVSNVMLVCPKCKKAVKVGFLIKDDTKKRICKSCKEIID